MPTYQYTCTACDHELEAVQSFSDDPLTECPECSGRLRKVFSAVGVVFKGSGFYRTDSRATANSNGSKNGESKSSEGTSGSKSSAESGTSNGKSEKSSGSKDSGSKDSSGSTSTTTPKTSSAA